MCICVCVYVLYFFFIIIPLFHRRAHHGFRQLFNFYSCNSSNKQEFSLIVSQQLRRFYFCFLFALDEKIFSYHIKKYNILFFFLFLNNFCCRRLRTLWIYYVSYLYIYFHFFFYLFICLFSLEKFCTLSYRFCLIKFKRKFDKQNLGKIKTTAMTTKSYSVSTINWAVFIKFQTHGSCFAFEHRFKILEVFLIINRFFGLSNWIFFIIV